MTRLFSLSRSLPRFWLAPLLVLLVGIGGSVGVRAAIGDKNVVVTEQVRAELKVHAPQGILPGAPLWLGLQLIHKPEWHTYWKNSGDSGLPTQLEWRLPAGVSAGEIVWPVPKKIPIGNLANYGYENTVLLPVPMTISSEFRPAALQDSLEVRLKASWLVCRKECIPEDGEFTLRIPLKGTTAIDGAAFEAALAAAPQALDGAARIAIAGDKLQVSVNGLPALWQGRQLAFFPETAEVIETAGAWTQAWQGPTWTAQIPLSRQRSQSPAVMPVVLALEGKGFRAEAPVSGQWPQAQTAASVSPALDAALRANSVTAQGAVSMSLVAALIGALIGGLILNLMPCVFPVLAIKFAGFARHAQDRHTLRIGALAYTAGVVASFLLLGVLMLALRAAGEQLGWGFQLQSPLVVSLLALLFTLIGLNLAGMFEFGQVLPSGLASLQARHPVADAALSGVLAVAVASPCTAPFMGASLGLAIALPAWEALLIFAALGVGMATPYLAASFVPAVARLLPQPGAWMQTLRHWLAFPMFATVVWLVWVLGQQSGIDGAGALLALLVAASMAIWALTRTGRSWWIGATLSLALLVGLGFALGPSIVRATGSPSDTQAQGPWQVWSPARVEQLLSAGQPVFVDFTAAWCVTCQYNKKTTLSNRGVLADLASKNVALLRADWTRRDPQITAALAQLGRSGVPVYVMYRRAAPPVVLSEILSASELRTLAASL
ncbi:MAG: protein-disulfide reductase DsbD family protein [Burkholderiaceae bacterium]|nr:protein-disulfide reductase DsbD family protein [Burkholderiaceae bacterium]MDO9088554.1 protein-disulfide reductase DsbD family protein [Burkholderiaceae bacterium]MDP1968392.1 protein-disulfide reductase DsbD family protein [Burkholderiaceae bacterium]